MTNEPTNATTSDTTRDLVALLAIVDHLCDMMRDAARVASLRRKAEKLDAMRRLAREIVDVDETIAAIDVEIADLRDVVASGDRDLVALAREELPELVRERNRVAQTRVTLNLRLHDLARVPAMTAAIEDARHAVAA